MAVFHEDRRERARPGPGRTVERHRGSEHPEPAHPGAVHRLGHDRHHRRRPGPRRSRHRRRVHHMSFLPRAGWQSVGLPCPLILPAISGKRESRNPAGSSSISPAATLPQKRRESESLCGSPIRRRHSWPVPTPAGSASLNNWASVCATVHPHVWRELVWSGLQRFGATPAAPVCPAILLSGCLPVRRGTAPVPALRDGPDLVGPGPAQGLLTALTEQRTGYPLPHLYAPYRLVPSQTTDAWNPSFHYDTTRPARRQ